MATSKAQASRHASEAIRQELARQSNQLDFFPDQIDYSALSTKSLVIQTARLTREIERRMGAKEGSHKAEGARSNGHKH